MSRALLVVYTDPVSAEQADQYNTWYNEVHLPDLLEVPGCVAARRYERGPALRSSGGAEHGFLAIYEIEGDIETFRAGLARSSPGMVIDPSLSPDGTSAVFWLPVAEAGAVDRVDGQADSVDA